MISLPGYRLFIFTVNVLLMLSCLTPGLTHSVAQSSGDSKEVEANYQEKHHLIFNQNSVVLERAGQELKIEMVNAGPVEPNHDKAKILHSGRDITAKRITYQEVWPGIDVVFDTSPELVLKSTYYIAAGASTEVISQIRLHYSHPVTTRANGELVIKIGKGWLTEKAPVAWQIIKGKRITVQVSFKKLSDHEIGFSVFDYNRNYPLIIDPELSWHTFLSPQDSWASVMDGMVIDDSENIYTAGYAVYSIRGVGSPIQNHSGTYNPDGLVMKFSTNGDLLGHTFSGAAAYDYFRTIALDSNGNIFTAGEANEDWGTNVKEHHVGNGNVNQMLVKLSNDGIYQWNTFFTLAEKPSRAEHMVIDSNDDIYILGNITSGFTLESYVMKYTNEGTYLWISNFGNIKLRGSRIEIGSNGKLYIVGYAEESWGNPVREHYGGYNKDCLVIVIDSNTSAYQWHTYLGGVGADCGIDLSVGATGDLYITGTSTETWGMPVKPHNYASDVFVAKLSSNGALLWNTFIGSLNEDVSTGMTIDSNDTLFISGTSSGNWPNSVIRSYSSEEDAFIASVGKNGEFFWVSFYGGSGDQKGYDIARASSGNLYVAGETADSWGLPILPIQMPAVLNNGMVLKVDNSPLLFTPTSTVTYTPTHTPSFTETVTESATISPTPSVTKTITESPTITPSPTASITISPTKTVSATITKTATVTYTKTVTSSPTKVPTITTVVLKNRDQVITYPSPARGSQVWFYYQVFGQAAVEITIYNLLGEKCHHLTDQHHGLSYARTSWNIDNVAQGIYFYKIKIKDDINDREIGPNKMVILNSR